MQDASVAQSRLFSRFAWSVFAYTIAVVLWGAFVRASISGDGCGTSWPDCGGSLLPTGSQLKTYVEFSHRVSSGILLPVCIALLVWARRRTEAGDPTRKAAAVALVFVIAEALIGAVLVRKGWVAKDTSDGRILIASLHLINTFVLVASLALTAWWGGGETRPQLRNQGPVAGLLAFALLCILGLSLTGSVSALGNTIYPANDHIHVMQAAALENAPLVIRHRPTHPVTAAVVAFVLSLAAGLAMHLRPSEHTRRFAYAIWFGLTLQMVAGLVTIFLAAPPAMQLVHLLLANLVWVSAVLLTASALAEGVPQVEMQHVPQAVLAGERPAIKDFVALTKPRVISLLLFTTLAAMFVAAQGWPGTSFISGLWALIATGTGLYAAAGSSNAINMVCERDLDVRMERTASRPTVTEKIHPRTALWFAFGLELFSFGLLWFSSNLLSAALALAGLVVYVIVYTLLLKRRTWSNIVIGGAAGAFPPLVGWAAASGELTPLAWLLFALIFVWTPVHFWALALLIKDDYAKAGVPMLPVVKGDRYTVVQIALYAVVTAAVSLAPVLPIEGFRASWIYGVAAVALNVVLLRGCVRLYHQVDRPRASSLFHYSMLYLALLFLALAVDFSMAPKVLS